MGVAVSRRSLLGLVGLVLAVSAANQWWSVRSEQSAGRELAALARPGDIRMLSSETCGFCTAARLWMQRNGVPFSECFIERDAACAKDFAATRAPGTPVVLVRGEAQLGFDAGRVQRGLAATAPG